jgi:hypothetical protein
MSKHQWLHAERGPEVVETSLTEMTAVLRCAASLADKEGMTHTAERLRNDAERVLAMWEANDGHLVVIVR